MLMISVLGMNTGPAAFVNSGSLCLTAQGCRNGNGSFRIRQVVNMAFFKNKNKDENIEPAEQPSWDESKPETFMGAAAAAVEEVKVKGIENLRTYKRDRYILGIVAIFIGLLFLIWPAQFLSMLAQCVGALLVISGVIALIMYFTNQERALIGGALVVIGIIIGVIGVWIIIHPEVLVGLAPKIIGLILIFSGMTGIGETVTLIRLDYDFWWLTLLLTSITIAIGVVLFVRPFEAANLFARIVGLTFLYDGITSIWITSRISAGVRKAKEAIHQFGQDVAQDLSAIGGAGAAAAGPSFVDEAAEQAAETAPGKSEKKWKGFGGLFGKGKKKDSDEIFTAAPEESGTGIGSMPDFYGAPETAGEPAAAPEGEAIPLGGPVEEKAGETAEEKTEEKKDDFDESIFIP